MNYYFLLEDEKSSIKVLPRWLKYMGIENERVPDITYVTKNNYVMQSGQGVTQLITRVLYQTMDTIMEHKGIIDGLIIILDSEEHDVEYRKEDVEQKIIDYKNAKGIELDFQYRIFVCNHCFETWLLGNAALYPKEEPLEESDFYNYYKHYDISENNPEMLIPPVDIHETIAAYHFHYLHEMCRFNKIRYTKKKPEYMAKIEYFESMIKRIKTTPHLESFAEFYQYFCEK